MKIAIPEFAGDVTCSINTAYLKYVHGAGHEPVLFSQYNDVDLIALECDGLLLPGGIDVEPTFYGEDNYGSHNCKPDKDDLERRALHAFILAGKGVFGICRGFQLMVREFIHAFEHHCSNIVFYQHVNNHSLATDRNALRTTPTHSVKANVAALYGADNGVADQKIFINSIHHQALIAKKKNLSVHVNADNYMNSLAITSHGAPTNPAGLVIVEAVDINFSGVRIRGVQWHPEELMDTALITNYFQEDQHDANIQEAAVEV
jgi:putative glutamine amidotransferase